MDEEQERLNVSKRSWIAARRNGGREAEEERLNEQQKTMDEEQERLKKNKRS